MYYALFIFSACLACKFFAVHVLLTSRHAVSCQAWFRLAKRLYNFIRKHYAYFNTSFIYINKKSLYILEHINYFFQIRIQNKLSNNISMYVTIYESYIHLEIWASIYDAKISFPIRKIAFFYSHSLQRTCIFGV